MIRDRALLSGYPIRLHLDITGDAWKEKMLDEKERCESPLVWDARLRKWFIF